MGRIALFLPLVLALIPALPSSGEGPGHSQRGEPSGGGGRRGLHGEIFRTAPAGIRQHRSPPGGGGSGCWVASASDHWLRAYAGMDQIDKEGKDILDNRYLHLRYNYRFSERLRTFHFLPTSGQREPASGPADSPGIRIRGRLLEGARVGWRSAPVSCSRPSA